MKDTKETCEYKAVANGAPFPRVRYESKCGFDLVVLDGYKRDLDYGITDELNLPSGKCIKCGKIITIAQEPTLCPT